MGEALRAELRQMHDNFTVRVTLIEPGMVDTPFFATKPAGALEPDDIARAVLYALDQPPGVDVNEMLIRPVKQPG
jgi:NADP-dependent 3-hydroxy acid dehydrogenase YdfG